MIRGFLDSYSRACCGSRILNTLLDLLYTAIRVSPVRPRGPLDRFYLLMVLFSFSYMGGLAYGAFIYLELKFWLIDLLVYILPITYFGSVIAYAVVNEQQKRSGVNGVKRRGGQIIVYAWIALAISLSLVALTSNLAYTPMIRTLWQIAFGALATMMTARAIRKSMNENNNHSPPHSKVE